MDTEIPTEGFIEDADMEVDEGRSDAILRYTIRNFSKIAENKGMVYSPNFYIKNMPWTILVEMNSENFVVYLYCCLPKDDTYWWCKFGNDAYCRILPTRSDVHLLASKIKKEVIKCDPYGYNRNSIPEVTFTYMTCYCAFPNVTTINFLLNPKNGYIEHDAITLELYICVKDPVHVPYIDCKKDDNCQEETNDLIQAITLGDAEKCVTFLQKNEYHNTKDSNGRTPLMWAAFKGNLKIVQLLLEANCEIDTTDNFGYTPLMRAVQLGHNLEVAKFLMAKGAKINIAARDCPRCDNSLKFTAIHFVVHHLNCEETAKFLINNGADLSSIKKETAVQLIRNGARSLVDSSTLIWSIASKEFELTKELLQREKHINVTDNEGFSPLMHAVHAQSSEIVGILLGKGANPCKRDKKGRSPFLESILTLNLALVECFLKYVPPFMIHYALHTAILTENIPMFKFLLKNKANVNAIDESGDTLLTKSIRLANNELAMLLTEHGADVNLKGKGKSIPICEAIKMNNLEIVTHLLSKGADVNTFDGNGSTPLLDCIRSSDLKTLQVLVENHADVNLRGKNGTIPLMESLNTEKQIFFKFLIDHGADFNFSDEEKEKIVSIAVETDNALSLMVLIDRGVDFSSCRRLLDELAEESVCFASYLSQVEGKKGLATCKCDHEEAASQDYLL